jgi:hypothetical protein
LVVLVDTWLNIEKAKGKIPGFVAAFPAPVFPDFLPPFFPDFLPAEQNKEETAEAATSSPRLQGLKKVGGETPVSLSDSLG